MKKNEITLMIVEDDESFATVLQKAVEEAGYKPLVAKKPEEALNALKIHDVHGFIIDCMLPQMSGLDLAQEIRKRQSEKAPIILMSGIFKDRSFMKDAIAKTNAVDFLAKPFDLETFQKKLDLAYADLIDDPLDPLSNTLINPAPTASDRLTAVKETKTIAGGDLPYILSLLCFKGISGSLKLTEEGGSTFEVNVADNYVTGVKTEDRQSFFGAILVNKDLVDPEELEAALQKPSEKRIGERLVDENLVSPHMIDVVFAEQIGIRLSSIIQDTSYDIQFQVNDLSFDNGSLPRSELNRFFCEWATSKFDLNHLRTTFIPWTDNTIAITPLFGNSAGILTSPPLNRMGSVVNRVKSGGVSLSQLLDDDSLNEEDIYTTLHVLILCGLAYFNPYEKKADFNSFFKRLKKIDEEIKTQTFFETLGVSRKAKSGEVKKAYHELAKVFHPDRVPDSAPVEVKELTDKVFAHMTEAYETLTHSTRRVAYEKELDQGQAEKIMESEAIFEEGKAALKAAQSGRALELFIEAMTLRPPTPELVLHELWARLMGLSRAEDKEEELKYVETGLEKIPPEERHNAVYYYVKGLFMKNLGNIDQAKRSVQQALQMDQSFVEAKRELNLLKYAEDDKPVDLLKGDLKDVVGLLFNKKKKIK